MYPLASCSVLFGDWFLLVREHFFDLLEVSTSLGFLFLKVIKDIGLSNSEKGCWCWPRRLLFQSLSGSNHLDGLWYDFLMITLFLFICIFRFPRDCRGFCLPLIDGFIKGRLDHRSWYWIPIMCNFKNWFSSLS